MLAKSDWPDDYVNLFWSVAPRKVGKGVAIKELNKLKNKGVISFEQLMVAWKLYAKAMIGKDMQYIAHPRTWLCQERWLDDPNAYLPCKYEAPAMILNNGKVLIKRGSAQARAWEKHRGRSIPWGPSGTWAFDTEWPPQ